MENSVKKEENERCKEICINTYHQIGWSVSLEVIMSWGISQKLYGFYKGEPTLMLRVNGLLFKGWVYVVLHEGADHYEVILLDNEKQVHKNIMPVFCDNLGTTIDNEVEKKEIWSLEEYKKALCNEK
jgi:hypothetical protein